MISIISLGAQLLLLILIAGLTAAHVTSPPSAHAHINHLQGRNGYGYNYGYNGGYYPVSSGYGGFGGVGEVVLGVLATLAGLALLASIVTALAAPLAIFTGRKRRDLADGDSFRDAATLQQFIQSVDGGMDSAPQRLMANYLTCAGLANGESQCLERLHCELSKPEAELNTLQRKAMDVIFDHLTGNQFLETEFKNRLLKAKTGHDCKAYNCNEYFKNT